MPKRDVVVEGENQELTDNSLRLDISSKPTFFRRFFTTNLFQRTLAHLVARGLTDSKLLRCTETGDLKVASVGAGYADNDTKTGNAPDSYGTAIEFDEICSRVDIFVYDNKMLFKRSPDGSRWNDEIELAAGSVYSIDAITKKFNIENETSSSVARYVIVGWY